MARIYHENYHSLFCVLTQLAIGEIVFIIGGAAISYSSMQAILTSAHVGRNGNSHHKMFFCY